METLPQTLSVRREERRGNSSHTGDGEDVLGSNGKRKEKKVDLERLLSWLLPTFLRTVAPNEASGYPESEHLIYDRNLCKGDCYINVA